MSTAVANPARGGSQRATWISAALTLTAAFMLKLAYSKAGADGLLWILAPSCWLAQRFGGLALAWEPGAGFISHSPRMVIGPACAGVNFLVVSWLALFFTRQTGLPTLAQKLRCTLASLAVAYLATIATNGLRVVLAAQLYAADIYGAWLTPERLHRALGVVLYCGVLLALCRLAERRLPVRGMRGARTDLAPLGWYAAVVLGIPLANRAFLRDPAQFAEHAGLTLVIGAGVALLFQVIVWVIHRLSSQAARP